MKLVLAKIESGVDHDPLVEHDVKHVREETAKLLLHRIPITVPSEELQWVLPEKFGVKLKPPKNGQGKQYSVLAIFGNPQDAQQAIENVNDRIKKDFEIKMQDRIVAELRKKLEEMKKKKR